MSLGETKDYDLHGPQSPLGWDLRINRFASLKDRLLQLMLSLSSIHPSSLSPGPVLGQVDGAKEQASALHTNK